MKKMVNDASANKDQLERQKEQQNANGYSMNPQTCGMLPKSVSLDKIAELERDHLKLTVTQKLAEVSKYFFCNFISAPTFSFVLDHS